MFFKKLNVIFGLAFLLAFFQYYQNNLTRGFPVDICYQVFLFQDEIPELQEFFLVNITSAVLITTIATVPQLGTEASLV